MTLHVEIVQYDCPHIDTTVEHDVSLHAKQCDFNPATEESETRISVSGTDSEALENGLTALRNHENVHSFDPIGRERNAVLLKTRLIQTDAMERIRKHDGTSPAHSESKTGAKSGTSGSTAASGPRVRCRTCAGKTTLRTTPTPSRRCSTAVAGRLRSKRRHSERGSRTGTLRRRGRERSRRWPRNWPSSTTSDGANGSCSNA